MISSFSQSSSIVSQSRIFCFFVVAGCREQRSLAGGFGSFALRWIENQRAGSNMLIRSICTKGSKGIKRRGPKNEQAIEEAIFDIAKRQQDRNWRGKNMNARQMKNLRRLREEFKSREEDESKR